MYEFVPAPGIKLARITSLSSDLAMALEALRVRIVAPIPGKAAVGIEVPNRTRETVYPEGSAGRRHLPIGQEQADDGARQGHRGAARLGGPGEDAALARRWHHRVGQERVGQHDGLLAAHERFARRGEDDHDRPEDARAVDLRGHSAPFAAGRDRSQEGGAGAALGGRGDGPPLRPDQQVGVRDIGGFNKKVEKHLELLSPAEQLSLFVDVDDISRPNPSEPLQKLPYIVVLIDEFADLMMVAGKEVEICVARIAQKARAAGIHLILATQRPSVDVITGLIKANFPSRIAFQVASRVDSRTILDAQGAENLLGMGDMLFTDRGQALRRIHGGLITDNEVHRVVEHLKQLGKPIYDMDILKPRGDDDEEGAEEEVVDELYDQAVRIVSEARQISISMLQRKMRIGYNRSARMIERMERDCIVGAADGAKGVREVLVHNH
jgi:S-DNA-T family DNA segregation ATPase FtsK/SpoIIIE